MFKKIVGIGFFILFLTGVFTSFYLLNFDQQGIVYGQEKVVYTLPYPGLLPDHPLYFIKAGRDKLMDLVTRDYIKKANLYLLFSDKRANMAMFLIKKGKNKLAITTFSKGEKYFWRIPNLLIASKKQGAGPPSEFIDILKRSNTKHRELINELLKSTPSTQIKTIEEILKLNQEIKDKLGKL